MRVQVKLRQDVTHNLSRLAHFFGQAIADLMGLGLCGIHTDVSLSARR